MTEGYSGTPLVKKLGIKQGYQLLLIGIRDNYFDLLESLPQDVTHLDPGDAGEANFIHFFTNQMQELKERLPKLKKKLAKSGMLWVSWPKGKSKIEKDLNENDVRKAGLDCGLVDVKVCAVDKDWSGLKFMYRLKDR